MDTIEFDLRKVVERLPELEWKLGALGRKLNVNALPRGLFHKVTNGCAKGFVDNIKTDIDEMQLELSGRRGRYLASRIEQKISVLVQLCQLHSKKTKTTDYVGASIQSLKTRQSWLQGLDDEMSKLSKQRQALVQRLHHINAEKNTELALTIHADIGKLEQRLSMAKEQFDKASGASL